MAEIAQLLLRLKKGIGSPPKSREDDNLPSKLNLTNIVFRLHTHITSVFLISSAALVFVQQYTGQHLKCLIPSEEDDDIYGSAITTYCFITGTYTVSKSSAQQVQSHPGVGQHIEGVTQQKFHHYFQWVPFVLLAQGLLFYLPHVLCISWENGKISNFFDMVRMNRDSISGDVKASPQALHFVHSMGYHRMFAASYLFLEILNLGNVILVAFVTDWFLQGHFLLYGLEYFKYLRDKNSYAGSLLLPTNLTNPMDHIFPKVSKCDFQKFGPSGQVVKYDILCVLALNVINEKIFLGLWICLVLLSVVGILTLIYRTILIISRSVRAYVVVRTLGHANMNQEDYHNVQKCILRQTELTYSDWFYLKRIMDNWNGSEFEAFCAQVHRYLTSLKKIKCFAKPTSVEVHHYSKAEDEPDGHHPLLNPPSKYDIEAVHHEQKQLERVPPYHGGSLAEIVVCDTNVPEPKSNSLPPTIENYVIRRNRTSNMYV